jgi:hypothetical protein
MRGLDPRIHLLRKAAFATRMDCPVNDDGTPPMPAALVTAYNRL